MVRLATELRETLQCMLRVGGPDNPVLPRLIDAYRDIARELGQQGDVERTLRDLLPSVLFPTRSAQPEPSSTSKPPRRTRDHNRTEKSAL
jgi:hypothetical protein